MKSVWRWTVLILVGVLFGWACNRQSTLPSAPPDATGIVELIQEPNDAVSCKFWFKVIRALLQENLPECG